MRESMALDAAGRAVAVPLPRRAATKAEYIQRFDAHQRLQHFLMMSSLSLVFENVLALSRSLCA